MDMVAWFAVRPRAFGDGMAWWRPDPNGLPVFRARSSSRPEAVTEFAETFPFVGLRVPHAVGRCASGDGGIWQVLASSAWSFSQLWVRLALGLFRARLPPWAPYTSACVGIGPRARPPPITGSPARAAPCSKPLARRLRSWCSRLLVVAVWDMVFKPWPSDQRQRFAR